MEKDIFKINKLTGHPIIAIVLSFLLFSISAIILNTIITVVASLVYSLFKLKILSLVLLILPLAFAYYLTFQIPACMICAAISKIYKASRTFYFNTFYYTLLIILCILSIGSFTLLFQINFFTNDLALFIYQAIDSLELSLDFGFINFFSEVVGLNEIEGGIAYAYFIYSISSIVMLVGFIKEFRFQSCHNCKRAFLINSTFSNIGPSRTRAEFRESGGYTRERTAYISSGTDFASVKYDEYTPKTIEFKGVYSYTSQIESGTCPICKSSKSRSAGESRRRIL